MNITWIDEPDELVRYCDTVEEGEVIGLDSESDHFLRYRPVVALIQVATREEAALVDPHALDVAELQPLFDVLADASVEKILHSCRNDISELDRDFQIPINNVFDTQVAARFLGYEKFSLDWLLEELCGIKVQKKFQRYDWMRRPISEGAVEYAAGDAVHLFPLYDRLSAELADSEWQEPFRQQMAYIEKTSCYTPSEFDPERWRRMKGAKGADGPTRAALAELYAYRHELCDRVNRAALHIFSNGALLHLARARPTTLGELQKARGVDDDILRTNGDEILAAIERSMKIEPPPARAPRGTGGSRPSKEEQERAKRISAFRAELTEELGLAHEFVLSPASIALISKEPPSNLAELAAVEGVLPWQVEEFGDELLEVL